MASELGMSLDELMPQSAVATRLQDAVASIEAPPDPPRSLAPEGASSPVQRAATRPVLQLGGAIWGRLTPGHDFANDFLHVTYAPGGQSCPEDNLIHHAGREYGYVLGGRLMVQVGFARYELDQGDSISFDSITPHRLYNPYDVDSESVWLVVGRGGTPVL
jgi:quercetin dioxygenase-like cupin family protein